MALVWSQFSDGKRPGDVDESAASAPCVGIEGNDFGDEDDASRWSGTSMCDNPSAKFLVEVGDGKGDCTVSVESEFRCCTANFTGLKSDIEGDPSGWKS